LKFRLVKKLPVYVLPPIWPSFTRVESALASDEYLASSAFRELVASIDFRPGSGWSQRWTGELLTWRMKKPAMRYAVHASKDLVLISARTIQHGVPVCVVVKTFARHGARRSTLGNSVAAAACRFQRAPVGLYAGFSDRVRFTGVPFPERLKPAPLNLIVKPSRPGYFDADAFEYDRFEFFDFDAF
jgi:hypothetical protein